MSGGKIPVWVNGTRYDGVKAAAEAASGLLGRNVSGVWVSRLMKLGRKLVVEGVAISPREPKPARKGPRSKPEAKAPIPAPEREGPSPGAAETLGGDGVQPQPERRPMRPSLLRYPRGEGPFERGACRAER